MGLYGNEECIYNKSCPNPYYLVECKNEEIKKNVVENSFCNICNKAKEPKINKNSTLKEMVEELEGHKKEIAKKQLLKIINGEA